MPMKTAMNRPKMRGRRQAEILDDLDVLAGGELADQIRRADQHDREQHQVVEHLVAHRFAEDIQGDRRGGAHDAASSPRRGAVASGVDTCRTKKSSRVSRIGLSEISRAPVGGQLRDETLGRRIERQLERVASVPDPNRQAHPRSERGDRRVGDVGHHQLPAARLEREHLGQTAAGDQASVGENRDAAAQGFGVAQHVRAEEHGAAAVAQPQDQRAHVPAPERIEARHRLVENHQLGIVDAAPGRCRRAAASPWRTSAAAGAVRRRGRPRRAAATARARRSAPR